MTPDGTKNVVGSVDFSEMSTLVVEHAAAYARALSAKVWLLHVAEPEPDFVGFDDDPQAVRRQVAERWRKRHRDLQEYAGELRARGLPATALLVQGPTVDTIVAEAERLQADLLVLAAHRHGALHKVLLGSVSEGVLREARCPLLILPAGIERR